MASRTDSSPAASGSRTQGPSWAVGALTKSSGSIGSSRASRKAIFEYVMVHEPSHLTHRDHSTAFWSLVKRMLPDYQKWKDWLEAHEVWLG